MKRSSLPFPLLPPIPFESLRSDIISFHRRLSTSNSSLFDTGGAGEDEENAAAVGFHVAGPSRTLAAEALRFGTFGRASCDDPGGAAGCRDEAGPVGGGGGGRTRFEGGGGWKGGGAAKEEVDEGPGFETSSPKIREAREEGGGGGEGSDDGVCARSRARRSAMVARVALERGLEGRAVRLNEEEEEEAAEGTKTEVGDASLDAN